MEHEVTPDATKEAPFLPPPGPFEPGPAAAAPARPRGRSAAGPKGREKAKGPAKAKAAAPRSRTARSQPREARAAAAPNPRGSEETMVGTSPVLVPKPLDVAMPSAIMPDLSDIPEEQPAPLPSTSAEDLFAKRWAVEDVRRWLQYTTGLAGRWVSPLWEAAPQEIDALARPLSTVGPRALEQLLRALNLPERVSEAIFRNPDLIALLVATAGYAGPRVMLLLNTIGKKDDHERPRDPEPTDRISEARLAVDRPAGVFPGSDSGSDVAARGNARQPAESAPQNGPDASAPAVAVQRTEASDGDGLPAGTPVPSEVWGALLR